VIDHLSITVSDLERAGRFYDAVMEALGYPRVSASEAKIGYGVRKRSAADRQAYISVICSEQVVADRRHWAFVAPDRPAVARFHEAGLAAGGRDDGAPGLRPAYHAHYYAAFLLDPDGNRIEAVCHAAGA
jgi:catechol 2,3-dioxygenase-like lactoylglutathione lyase family enzyme